jgi:hypothetical protein
MAEWTRDDSRQANLEGWDIFNCIGSDSGDWQIQRLDDLYDTQLTDEEMTQLNEFENDPAVWRFVGERKTELHRKAMDFIAENCKEEFDRIQQEVNKEND